MFFDSTVEDEREYSADEFAEYFRVIVGNGIFNGGTNLQVSCSGSDMSVYINQGYGWLEGYLYRIDSEPLTLTLNTADVTNDRIDRIVIRLDKTLENRYIKAFVLEGVAAATPTLPALTRDENIFEISLAQAIVRAGKSFIAAEDVVDERLDINVCGLMNSLVTADTTSIFNQFQAWYDTKTLEYQNQWEQWWQDNPDIYEQQWLNWFNNYQPGASGEFNTWLDGVKAVWLNWFGSDISNGIQKTWNDWLTQAQNNYNEAAYEENAILIAMGGF